MASPWNQHCADCIGTLSFLRIRVVLPVEQEYDGVGGAGVESGRRFVEEQGAWTDDQLHADVRSLPLSARHAADELRPDLQRFDRAMLCISGTSHGPVSMSVCHKSKRLNKSSWLLACELLPPVLHCIKRKFGYLQK